MKTAFVFPGQGSQSLGMLSDIAQQYPQVLTTFEEASAAIDIDLWKLCQEGPESELNRTELTQPAILTASVALWRLWRDQGSAMPAYVAGHSLGEYSALVAAEVIDFNSAVALVHERGKLMQQAVPAGMGAMAAVIGLDDDLVVTACREAAEGQVVDAVNFNSPGQVVIAGHAAAVERAGRLCKEKGAKRVLPLPVSVPSHCALMEGAAQKLAGSLDKITLNKPVIPILQNVSAAIEIDPGLIKGNLVKQLYSPVLWTQTVQRLAALEVKVTVECGPGKVLSGLCKRIVDGMESFATTNLAEFGKTLETLNK